ncbi:MAG: hypothetical protein IT457_25220 [Planctomycetes bacterium]|nr:hypothetical protein [Planctomycetota bacterium]
MSDRQLARMLALLAAALAPCTPIAAQKLRFGVADASLVVIAESSGSKALDEHLVLHEFRVIETLKGAAEETLTVIEHAHVADAPAPQRDGRRLLCLVPDRRAATPKSGGPFWRMTGYAGDNPPIDTSPASDDVLRLARTLVDAERGLDQAELADRLVTLALSGRAPAQREAIESLREREALRRRIPRIELDALLARAVAETGDVELKIALGSLCAEAGMRNTVEALCSALTHCQDERFAKALGRIAAHAHGERATAVLNPFLQQARGATRDALLLALGATATDSALAQLIQLRERQGAQPAIDAALRAHGSQRALEIVEPKRKDGGPR